MFESEADEIKTVLETLILLYGDNLGEFEKLHFTVKIDPWISDEFGKRLKAIRKSFVNQRALLAWLKSEYQIIPYEALYAGAKLKWVRKDNSLSVLGSTNDWELHRHFQFERSPLKIFEWNSHSEHFQSVINPGRVCWNSDSKKQQMSIEYSISMFWLSFQFRYSFLTRFSSPSF